MAAVKEGDNESKKESPQSAPPRDPAVSRRYLLRVGLSLAVVLVVAGIAGVAKSLVSPANPPQAEEVQPPAPAQTTTVTQTQTVTASPSASQSSSSSSSSTSQTTSSSETSSASPFPRLMVVNISGVSETEPVFFNYPLEETPNILVKLGAQAPGGVGPDGDIVAFSQVCQHLGCIYGYVPTGGAPTCDSSYKAAAPVGYCCCHGTIYDLTNGGKVTAGPSPRPIPQVTLEFDASTGDIYAVGMGPPTIFGHDTGSNDVLNDLQGGTLVS